MRIKAISNLIGVLLLANVCSLASAQVTISDNFDDGNDDGWEHRNYTQAGNWEVVDGEYRLNTVDPVNVGQLGVVDSSFRLDSPIGDGFFRAKIRANTAGTSPAMSLESSTDPLEFYLFAGSSQDGEFNIWRCVDVSSTQADCEYWTSPTGLPRFNANEDWWMEVGKVDDMLSLKAWPDGTPEPDAPQVFYQDPGDPLEVDHFAVSAWVSTGWTSRVQTDASFDDISFRPVPEPSTNILLWAFAAIPFALRRFRRQR